MSTAVQGFNANMHASIAASGSGGRRPDRGNGGLRPPDRGLGKVTKKTKKGKKCLACQKWGHTVEECRLYGAVLRNIALSRQGFSLLKHVAVTQTRVLPTGGSSRPPVTRRHPLGAPQQHSRISLRQRRTARRLAGRQQQEAQEQLGRQEHAPQEQSPQDQRPQRSAESRMRPAPRVPPEEASCSDQMDINE
ncbi:hypothetical protein CNMCM8694_003927 [Aspergillus lentulus]|nr:hypothetical protein CNMCM8060_003923 [Aspergillus lentulus]KAF4177013.1 hypothetical protein CNMCM7927_003591 [Aspergillus lentulus]KAF4189917.1 hypothetical protein CNMCM8694_003927 [Aspergillus lentulus]